MQHTCPNCQTPQPDKGRAPDGRRAYRCTSCNKVWTEGLQGLSEKRYSPQRQTHQFHDTGASTQEDINVT